MSDWYMFPKVFRCEFRKNEKKYIFSLEKPQSSEISVTKSDHSEFELKVTSHYAEWIMDLLLSSLIGKNW